MDHLRFSLTQPCTSSTCFSCYFQLLPNLPGPLIARCPPKFTAHSAQRSVWYTSYYRLYCTVLRYDVNRFGKPTAAFPRPLNSAGLGIRSTRLLGTSAMWADKTSTMKWRCQTTLVLVGMGALQSSGQSAVDLCNPNFGKAECLSPCVYLDDTDSYWVAECIGDTSVPCWNYKLEADCIDNLDRCEVLSDGQTKFCADRLVPLPVVEASTTPLPPATTQRLTTLGCESINYLEVACSTVPGCTDVPLTSDRPGCREIQCEDYKDDRSGCLSSSSASCQYDTKVNRCHESGALVACHTLSNEQCALNPSRCKLGALSVDPKVNNNVQCLALEEELGCWVHTFIPPCPSPRCKIDGADSNGFQVCALDSTTSTSRTSSSTYSVTSSSSVTTTVSSTGSTTTASTTTFSATTASSTTSASTVSSSTSTVSTACGEMCGWGSVAEMPCIAIVLVGDDGPQGVCAEYQNETTKDCGRGLNPCFDGHVMSSSTTTTVAPKVADSFYPCESEADKCRYGTSGPCFSERFQICAGTEEQYGDDLGSGYGDNSFCPDFFEICTPNTTTSTTTATTTTADVASIQCLPSSCTFGAGPCINLAFSICTTFEDNTTERKCPRNFQPCGLGGTATSTITTTSTVITVDSVFACPNCAANTAGQCKTQDGSELCVVFEDADALMCPSSFERCIDTTSTLTLSTETITNSTLSSTSLTTVSTTSTTSATLNASAAYCPQKLCAFGAGPCINPVINFCLGYTDAASRLCPEFTQPCLGNYVTVTSTPSVSNPSTPGHFACAGCTQSTEGECFRIPFGVIANSTEKLCTRFSNANLLLCPDGFERCMNQTTTSTSATLTTSTATDTTSGTSVSSTVSTVSATTATKTRVGDDANCPAQSCRLNTAGPCFNIELSICSGYQVGRTCPETFRPCHGELVTSTATSTPSVRVTQVRGELDCDPSLCLYPTSGECKSVNSTSSNLQLKTGQSSGQYICVSFPNPSLEVCPESFERCMMSTTTSSTSATSQTTVSTTSTTSATLNASAAYCPQKLCAFGAGPCINPVINFCLGYTDAASRLCPEFTQPCLGNYVTVTSTPSVSNPSTPGHFACAGCTQSTEGECFRIPFGVIANSTEKLCTRFSNANLLLCPDGFERCMNQTTTSTSATLTTSTATDTTSGTSVSSTVSTVSATTATKTRVGDDANCPAQSCRLNTAGPCFNIELSICSGYQVGRTCPETFRPCHGELVTSTATSTPSVRVTQVRGELDCDPSLCLYPTSGECKSVNSTSSNLQLKTGQSSGQYICVSFPNPSLEVCPESFERCMMSTTTSSTSATSQTTVSTTSTTSATLNASAAYCPQKLCAFGAGPCINPVINFCLGYTDAASRLCPEFTQPCLGNYVTVTSTPSVSNPSTPGHFACAGCTQSTEGECFRIPFGVIANSTEKLCTRFSDANLLLCPDGFERCMNQTTTSTSATLTTSTATDTTSGTSVSSTVSTVSATTATKTRVGDDANCPAQSCRLNTAGPCFNIELSICSGYQVGRTCPETFRPCHGELVTSTATSTPSVRVTQVRGELDCDPSLCLYPTSGECKKRELDKFEFATKNRPVEWTIHLCFLPESKFGGMP